MACLCCFPCPSILITCARPPLLPQCACQYHSDSQNLMLIDAWRHAMIGNACEFFTWFFKLLPNHNDWFKFLWSHLQKAPRKAHSICWSLRPHSWEYQPILDGIKDGMQTKSPNHGRCGGVRWGIITIYDHWQHAVRIMIRTIPSFNLSLVLCQTGVAFCAHRSLLTCSIVGLLPMHGKPFKWGEFELLCLCFWLVCFQPGLHLTILHATKLTHTLITPRQCASRR